jgi:phosphatidylserine decarboxylase
MKIHQAGYSLLIKTLAACIVVNAATFILFPGTTTRYVVLAFTVITYLFLLNFFRSPRRQPAVDAHAVIAPADGRVVVVEETYEGEYLKRPCLQVSIFMNIFNVHVNWFAIAGTVTHVRHHPGRHLVAYLPKSSTDNERSTIAIRSVDGEEIVMRQIAGAMARRVVTYAVEGSKARQDMHAGFIKFGSRVDIFLPVGTPVHVDVGQKVTGARTLIATLR